MRRANVLAVIKFIFKILTRIEVTGLENVPAQGGAILSSNHLSRVDPPLLFILLKRQDATGLVADKYKNKPFFRWLISMVDPIWINRESADIQALREARDYLQKGGLLGIAPEGTRSHTGALIQAKTGVAFLADRANVPIIPIAITGTEKAFRELGRLHRPLLTVRFGQPFTFPPLDRQDRNAALQRNTDEIMCRIAAMLPPQYRGVYADHPRLKEFLTEGN